MLVFYQVTSRVSRVTYPSGRTVEYLPQAGDPAKVGAVQAEVGASSQMLASDITYDPFGDMNGVTYGNGLDLMVTRDLRGFPTNINVGSMAGTVLDLNYTADAFGNITGIAHLDPARNQAFTYDRLNQLKTAGGAYGNYSWNYDALGNRTQEVWTPTGSTVVNTTDYSYDPGTNRLGGSTTVDPPVAAFYNNYVLTLIYPKHHLPQGQPLQEQYYGLLDELIWLLDRADAGKKNVYLAPYLAQTRAFINHAQFDQATLHGLLADQGVPQDILQMLDAYLWWDYRLNDLAAMTPEARDNLRAWAEYAYLLQIVAIEADQAAAMLGAGDYRFDAAAAESGSVVNYRDYRYDAAGTLAGQTISGNLTQAVGIDYRITEGMRLAGVAAPFGNPDVYYYDHLGRRVIKQAMDGTVTAFIYDLAGNLIGEASPNGNMRRDWVYLGMHRLAVIEGPAGGGGISCGGCGALYSGAQNATAAVVLFAVIFLIIGVLRKNKKFTALGCIFLVIGLTFLTMPTATSQVGGEQVYYYHNDHLGTPRVLTDSLGNVAWDVDYKPFGEIYHYYANSLPDTQPFRFPGQYDDGWTRFSYNWNRYYMPETGRYSQVDPLFLDDNEIFTYCLYGGFKNLFVYSSNNPINFIDPMGLDRYEPCKKWNDSGNYIKHYICKKLVDWACSGKGSLGCCKSDYANCMAKLSSEQKNYARCQLKCEVERTQCEGSAGSKY